MGKSKIEWTEAVWNPMTGCTKVSPGCKNCYAEREWPRLSGPNGPYAGRAFTDVGLHPGRLGDPMRWQKPRRVFVNSMSDLFHEAIPDDFIDMVFAAMAMSPQHQFQILTKRAQRMRRYFSETQSGASREQIVADTMRFPAWASLPSGRSYPRFPAGWPLPNAWLGVSCEDQQTADERIPELLATPAAIRWVSAEPLLDYINLRSIGARLHAYYADALAGEMRPTVSPTIDPSPTERIPRLDWVVVGGESGPHARPMNPEWARSLRDQCAAADVPFYFKQWGEWIGDDELCNCSSLLAPQIADPNEYFSEKEWTGHSSSWRIGKRAAGRLLDGRLWDEYPVTAF